MTIQGMDNVLTRHRAHVALVGVSQIALLAIFACESPRANTPVASGSAVASAMATRSLNSPASGYKIYVSPGLLYSLEYPATWYSFPEEPVFDSATNKVFSNENTKSPEGLDDDGVFVSLTIDPKDAACSLGPGANDPRITLTPISIDRAEGMQWVATNGIGAVVAYGGWCYRLDFLTAPRPDARDKYRSQIDHMLASFRFNR